MSVGYRKVIFRRTSIKQLVAALDPTPAPDVAYRFSGGRTFKAAPYGTDRATLVFMDGDSAVMGGQALEFGDLT